jgi:XisI protein
MDKKLTKYRKILREVLNEYAAGDKNLTHKPDDTQIRLIMDTENDHYQVLYAGWLQTKQIFSVIFHFDIIDGKIWIQRNISDYDIIEDIEAKGVPKKDIVLAFHAPEIRSFTEYATA